MKKEILYIVFISLIISASTLYAQVLPSDSSGFGREYQIGQNDENNPCITLEQYRILDKEIKDNQAKFGLNKILLKETLTTSFIWPLRLAAGQTDSGYYFVSAYVDENTAAGSIKDYNCGTNTYDGHKGTDIAAWPYGFYKMDNNHVEVIAAAPGTIIQKSDGNFDRNCATNNLTANSIIIQHADGTQALYWHMKKNSVTSKAVGQTVAAGEYLGVVGSSGSSSGPHLHFEVWSGSSNNTYNDPFSGACNTLNKDSWWTTQKPYTEPAVLKVSVNTTDAVMSPCPATEIPNESSTFTVPFQGPELSPGYAKFYMFLRNMPTGANIELKILNPDGTTFNSWTYSVTTAYKVSYWSWSKKLPLVAGKYKFQSIYDGVVCFTNFEIFSESGIRTEAGIREINFSPNPANNIINIVADGIGGEDMKFNLINALGEIMISGKFEIENSSLNKTISISELPDGVYFLVIGNEKNKCVKKIIKFHN